MAYTTEELEKMMAEATKHFKLPFIADLSTMKIFDAEYRMVADIRGWGYLTGKGDGALGLSEDEGIAAQKKLITSIVAAVNALPELVALRKENERLREALEKLTDCQPVPKVYKYTGTAEVDVESMFDVGHRHKSGKQPRDYLMSWLSMFRPFAYATKDDSWGELEKLISIVMNNYVQILVRAEATRAALSQEAGS